MEFSGKVDEKKMGLLDYLRSLTHKPVNTGENRILILGKYMIRKGV